MKYKIFGQYGSKVSGQRRKNRYVHADDVHRVAQRSPAMYKVNVVPSIMNQQRSINTS